MATKRLTVDDVLETIFDDEFGLSDGESSDEECGEDLYAYLGESVVSRSDVDALTRAIVSDGVRASSGDEIDGIEDDSHELEEAEGTINFS